MLKIVSLNDNRTSSSDYEYEHGLSLYIEVDNKKIIFDTGQTDIFKKNANKLGISLNDLDFVVLSHGDYDHGNGLIYLDDGLNLICHPNYKCYRISKRTGKFDGLKINSFELSKKFNVIESDKNYSLFKDVIFLGEIEKSIDFETDKNLPMVDKKGITYNHLDDSGIVIKTNKGIIVISGCSHSGICNTIEYAKKITGDTRVYTVIGGFHLKKLDEQTLKTIEYMKKNNIKKIYLCHCTSDIVCEKFIELLPGISNMLKSGEIIYL